ncbi:MAG: TRAP transporter fused permease subunit [Hyphomicrobiales bacterium]|nr:TRAP transporter fused permease subunit [Hyphomicrobiales bacterium]
MLTDKRDLSGPWALIARLLAGLLPLAAALYAFDVFSRFGLLIYKEQFLGFFLAICLIVTFIWVPLRPGLHADRVPWYDVLALVASAAVGIYFVGYYHVLVSEFGFLTTDKIVASGVGLLLLIEATRRQAGTAICAIGVVVLLYAYFGRHLPGLLEVRPLRFDRLLIYTYMGQGNVFGIPLYVAASIVTAFLFFGKVLFGVGAGKYISDLAFAVVGHRRGGPAKVAVVASALFGSLSGSASANVATTGMVTIPMMKRNGYTPYEAAAIESVASTGGLILPPVMAATGFLIAEFLDISYAEVALAALWPALLLYAGLFIQVDLEAARRGMRGVAVDDLPPMREALRHAAPLVFPVGLLLYMLFGLHWRPEAAGLAGTAAIAALSLVLKEFRRPLRAFLDMVVETGEAVVYVALICAVAGLVMGVLGITGLGTNMSQALVQASGGQVWLLLLLAALGSIVLGMGVPVTATYIILVVLVGPALIQGGVPPLAAHLFVFYFGTLSFLTPPVCIAVFVAAAIAECPPMRTGFLAVRMALVAYLLPFVFVFNPAFLLDGGTGAIINMMLGSVLGVFMLCAGVVGFLGRPLSLLMRVLMVAVGIAALVEGAQSWLWLTGAAVAAVALVGISTRSLTINRSAKETSP